MVRGLARLEAFVEPDAYMYFQDVGDHLARLADQIDTYRDVANGTMDIYLSSQSNRMNGIMKQLTVVATIFMPLTLISGIYGMNVLKGMWPPVGGRLVVRGHHRHHGRHRGLDGWSLQEERLVVEERDAQPVVEEVHHTVYSVANLITIMRLLLVPFFFTVLVDADGERGRLTAFFIYAIAASTDWIDGQIARRTHTVTQFGKIVDPLVDRLLLASGVVGLYLIDELPLWVPIVLVLRDVYLLYGAYVAGALPRHPAGDLHREADDRGAVRRLQLAHRRVARSAGRSDSSSHPGFPGSGRRAAALGIWFVYVGIVLSLSAAVQYTVIALRARDAAIAAGRG